MDRSRQVEKMDGTAREDRGDQWLVNTRPATALPVLPHVVEHDALRAGGGVAQQEHHLALEARILLRRRSGGRRRAGRAEERRTAGAGLAEERQTAADWDGPRSGGRQRLRRAEERQTGWGAAGFQLGGGGSGRDKAASAHKPDLLRSCARQLQAS